MATAMVQQCCAASRSVMNARSARLGRSSGAAVPALHRSHKKKAHVRQLFSNARSSGGVVVRAMSEEASGEEDAFENRLTALRGKRSKRAAVSPDEKAAKDMGGVPEGASSSSSPPRGQKRKGVRDFTVVGTIDEPATDWGPETIKYEGPPARGEVFANLAMSWTVVLLPLAIAAIGRALWASYKITDKRVSILSTSPLRTERTDVPMDEIVDVIAIGRGVGLWGDMVITLKNQEKLELRSLPDFKEIEAHIRERMGQADPEYAKL